MDLYEDAQGHTLRSGKGSLEVFGMELTRIQRRILRHLGIPKIYET
jgi:hypothetical protein